MLGNRCMGVPRVRNHLTGHGNGDVYADVRNGKPVFVKIAPCLPAADERFRKESY